MEYQDSTNVTERRPLFFDIETTGLNPMIEPWYSQQTSEVTAIGVGVFKDGQTVKSFTNHGGEEYHIIKEAIKWFAEYSSLGVDSFRVGWNIKAFDDPYLGARAARLNQDARPIFKLRRLDMMRALSIDEDWWANHSHDGKNRHYPKQDDYARYLEIPFNGNLEGSQMPQAFENGDYEKIEEHVVDDIHTMMSIYEHEEDALLDHYINHYNLE